MEYILQKEKKYIKQKYSNEEELEKIFSKNYQYIISNNSFFFNLKKQTKSKKFKNYNHSIADGFLLTWDNPTTPSLYITEIELEKHKISSHILPQIGNFISFIQSAKEEEINKLKKTLYDEIKRNTKVFSKIKENITQEVHELITNSITDLQFLLIIDRISPELSIGLSQIERSIKVKIRKIEISIFKNNRKKIILYSDSETIDSENIQSQQKSSKDEYPLDFHYANKSKEIISMFKHFLKSIKKDSIIKSVMKHYIGFRKGKNMIFSCVIRKNSLVFYSKAKITEISPKKFNISTFRNVSKIGHYTNHLPTEIVIKEKNQLKNLINYINKVIRYY